MTDSVQIRRDQGVLEITLNRPPVNAINLELSRGIADALTELQTNPELSAALITAGEGKVFSAGWDLKEAASERSTAWTDWGRGGFAGITEYFDLEKPVIAAVSGAAIGGGFEIALACDMIIASENAFFALPEMPICALPIAGGIQRLPRKIPQNIAFEMLLTGRRMSAEEAARWGLVNKLVKRDQLLDEARSLAREFTKFAPVAVRALKESLRAADSRNVEDAFHLIASNRLPRRREMLASPDRVEGPRAFVEKRAPKWSSR